MIRQDASGLICTSPVKMPTFSAPKVCLKSLNFWFESALMGDVYTALRRALHQMSSNKLPKLNGAHLVMCLMASAMAYSATTVLPAEVCAATKTLSPFSLQPVFQLLRLRLDQA